MGGKIGFIIIIIVALGIGLYIYSSGALVAGVNSFDAILHFSSSSLFAGGASSTASGSSSGGGGWWGIFGPGNGGKVISVPPPQDSGTIYFNQGAGSSGTSSAPAINPADIPAGYTAAELSPYFHDVRLGGVSAGTAYYYGTISLIDDNYNNASATIDVTGWKIETRDSGEYVPQAINIYDPSGLTPPSDIVLKSGDTVHMYSSSAPFNLRINECTGYIAHVADFVPQIPQSCPQTDFSQIRNFTGQCQNYIESIGGCSQPDMTSSQIPHNDYACQDYLESHFTYKSCFEAHAGDADFLSNQIWVWTGNNVIDQYHDTVKLLDRKGLLVDIYSF